MGFYGFLPQCVKRTIKPASADLEPLLKHREDFISLNTVSRFYY